MSAQSDEIIEDIKKNFPELIAGFTIMVLVLMLLYMKKFTPTPVLIVILACVSIALLGLEKRAESFDRVYAMSVVLILGLGFLFYS